jgi:hypothetical protein
MRKFNRVLGESLQELATKAAAHNTEVTMSSTQTNHGRAARIATADRAKAFYGKLGWTLDADFTRRG